MTPDVGLIEWVQNTRPLKVVLEDGMGMPLASLPACDIFIKFVSIISRLIEGGGEGGGLPKYSTTVQHRKYRGNNKGSDYFHV